MPFRDRPRLFIPAPPPSRFADTQSFHTSSAVKPELADGANARTPRTRDGQLRGAFAGQKIPAPPLWLIVRARYGRFWLDMCRHVTVNFMTPVAVSYDQKFIDDHGTSLQMSEKKSYPFS